MSDNIGTIIISDEEFLIEWNSNYKPFESGNAFLCEVKNHHACVGSIDKVTDGKWGASINAPYDPENDSDSEHLGYHESSTKALAALWNARHKAI